MASLTKDLLRRDECQPLTSTQIADIKAQTATRPKANVYIKPYEIMDLDGTEEVVGEVQKTIDGVKKKKPLYEKTIIANDIVEGDNVFREIANISSWNIDKVIKMKSIWKDRKDTQIMADGFYYRPMFWQNTGTIGVRIYAMNTDGTKVDGEITIDFTKSTDSWQPV